MDMFSEFLFLSNEDTLRKVVRYDDIFILKNCNATTQLHIPAFVLAIHHGLHHFIKIHSAIILMLENIISHEKLFFKPTI
jgi:hypothetical protein